MTHWWWHTNYASANDTTKGVTMKSSTFDTTVNWASTELIETPSSGCQTFWFIFSFFLGLNKRDAFIISRFSNSNSIFINLIFDKRTVIISDSTIGSEIFMSISSFSTSVTNVERCITITCCTWHQTRAVITLSGHFSFENSLWNITNGLSTISDITILTCWCLTWFFINTTLRFFFNPDTSFTSECPNIGPSSRNIITLALTFQVAFKNTIRFVTSILSIGSFWNFTFQIPFTATSLIPFTSLCIAIHNSS